MLFSCTTIHIKAGMVGYPSHIIDIFFFWELSLTSSVAYFIFYMFLLYNSSSPFWWSAFRTSPATAQAAWTPTRMHTEPKDQQRMPSPLPSTQPSHILKITSPPAQWCLLISGQHITQPPPPHPRETDCWLSPLGLEQNTLQLLIRYTNRPQAVLIVSHTPST